jgi:hypothetical protein
MFSLDPEIVFIIGLVLPFHLSPFFPKACVLKIRIKKPEEILLTNPYMATAALAAFSVSRFV